MGSRFHTSRGCRFHRLHEKIVYIAALNKNHLGIPFKTSQEIIARADQVYSLTAVCAKCGEDATFTQRVMNGREVFGEAIKIGGMESYEPRCRNCFVFPSVEDIKIKWDLKNCRQSLKLSGICMLAFLPPRSKKPLIDISLLSVFLSPPVNQIIIYVINF
ncbi:hypothetical protein [Acidiplasma cupricumulans]|uniref:hypothetical protein n=1 Tax=Acidiplasma cupricumulans TaxID=312540 RepID=UPI0015851D15|nr:hypothetical protein [Acidiplasma cupricumulans]